MNELRDMWSDQERSRLGTVDSWFSLIGGSALAAFGVHRAISKRSPLGIAMATGGGLLLYNGLRPRTRSNGVHIQAAFTINKPVGEVYRQWRELENLPKFMKHLKSVRQLDNRRSEWTAQGPMGATFSWQSEIIDEADGKFLVWRSMPGSLVENTGSAQFREAPGGRGTELIVAMDYSKVGGHVGQFLSDMLGAVPERVLREELRNFKQLMEAGEIPTTEGQPTGRRGAVVSMMNKVMRMPARTGERTA
jgi:uncharacterized membrane protein